LSDVLKSRTFIFSDAPEIVKESLKQAQLLCLELVNSLCSLFASDDDLAKLSMLSGIVCVLLRLENAVSGWLHIFAFLETMHDFLAARRSCTFSKGIILRAAVDFYVDILSKMQRTLDVDKQVTRARDKMRTEDGATVAEAEAAIPYPEVELAVDECSTDSVLELEYQRRQSLCCLFHLDLLEYGSDLSLIHSHLQPKGPETPNAAPLPLNSKDPVLVQLQIEQPQHLSSKPLTAPTTKPKFFRVIGASSMMNESGRSLARWAFKQLELPIQDIIRPKSRKGPSTQAAATLWYFFNSILTGALRLDAAKCTTCQLLFLIGFLTFVVWQ
jgi:hypothetical protein